RDGGTAWATAAPAASSRAPASKDRNMGISSGEGRAGATPGSSGTAIAVVNKADARHGRGLMPYRAVRRHSVNSLGPRSAGFNSAFRGGNSIGPRPADFNLAFRCGNSLVFTRSHLASAVSRICWYLASACVLPLDGAASALSTEALKLAYAPCR